MNVNTGDSEKFKFECPQCGQRISVNANQCGQSGKCPHCSKLILIPKNTPTPPPLVTRVQNSLRNHELYYLWIEEKQAGPYTHGQLKSMWSSGSITANTLYWVEDNQDWKPLLDIAGKLEEKALPPLDDNKLPAKRETVNLRVSSGNIQNTNKRDEGSFGAIMTLLIIVMCAAGVWYYFHLNESSDDHSSNPVVEGGNKLTGVYVWNTTIMGVRVVITEDLRSDGTDYHEATGLTDHPLTENRTWRKDGNQIVVTLTKDGDTSTQVFRQEGNDLLLVKNGDKNVEPTRYIKQ